MYIAYYDETGDDGYPEYSSPVFVLTACYFHHLHWKDSFEAIRQFRANLKTEYGLPIKMEMHSKYFLLGKRPYRQFQISDVERIRVFDEFCNFIAQLNLKFVNIAIVKNRIRKRKYKVLDTAFSYSITRIENDLDPNQNPTNRFMIISDEGRVGAMRRTSRKIQRQLHSV